MSRHRRKDPLVWGLILIAIGAIFLLQNFVGFDAWDYVWKLWPLVLIIWGAQKLLDGLQSRKDKSPSEPPAAPRV